MAKRKTIITRVQTALKEAGLKDAFELFKRAYRWAHSLALNMSQVKKDHRAYDKQRRVAGYLLEFIRGNHHKTFRFA